MLEFSPTKPAAIEAMQTSVSTDYGSATARYFQGYGSMCWLAFVGYHLADGVEILRPSPMFPTSTDARDWIEDAIEEGPGFVVPLVATDAASALYDLWYLACLDHPIDERWRDEIAAASDVLAANGWLKAEAPS